MSNQRFPPLETTPGGRDTPAPEEPQVGSKPFTRRNLAPKGQHFTRGSLWLPEYAVLLEGYFEVAEELYIFFAKGLFVVVILLVLDVVNDITNLRAGVGKGPVAALPVKVARSEALFIIHSADSPFTSRIRPERDWVGRKPKKRCRWSGMVLSKRCGSG